jgi:hypothetical protein
MQFDTATHYLVAKQGPLRAAAVPVGFMVRNTKFFVYFDTLALARREEIDVTQVYTTL